MSRQGPTPLRIAYASAIILEKAPMPPLSVWLMVPQVPTTPAGATLIAIDPQAFVEEDACWHQVHFRGGVRTCRCVKVEMPK